MKLGLSAVAIAAAALLAAGCGGDDSDGASEPEASDEEQIRELHEEYIQAIFAGDGPRACDLLADPAAVVEEAATNTTGFQFEAASCAQVIQFSAGFLGGDEPEILRLDDLVVTGETAGGTSVTGAQEDEISFVRVDGEWKIADDE